MSECVVRMEMPQNCYECSFSVIDDTGIWCNAITNQVYGYTERDEDCPILCQLPEGHGRLKDDNQILVKIDAAPLWDSSTTYQPGDKVMYHGKEIIIGKENAISMWNRRAET